MKRTVVIPFFILMLLSGCSSREVTHYDYLYRGESDLCTVEYSIIGTATWNTKGEFQYDSRFRKVLTLTLRDDISTEVKYLNIEFDLFNQYIRQSRDYNNTGRLIQQKFRFETESNGDYLPNEFMAFSGKVTLDDVVQTIELKYVED